MQYKEGNTMTDIKRLYGDNDKSSNVIAKDEAMERLPNMHEFAAPIDDGIHGKVIPFRSAPGESEEHRSYPSRGFRASGIL
jgi:hypothetical protein